MSRLRSLNRALDILEFVCSNGGVGVDEISKALDIPKSTVYRLLSALREREYVRRSGPDSYEAGLRLLTLQGITERQNQLIQVARPHLQELARSTGQTAHLAILSTNHVGYIDTVVGERGFSIYPSIGTQTPLHCTSLGKVLLAHLPPKSRQAILDEIALEKRTPKTITSRSKLEKNLAQVRRQGYAVDNGEFEVGLKCIGAPVHNASEEVIAAISVSGLAPHFEGDMFPDLVETVRQAAEEISRDLGYLGNIFNSS